MQGSSTGLPNNIALFLCYVLGWLSGLIMILIEKENDTVRYHAAQSIVIFGSYTVLNMLLPFVPFLGALLMSVLFLAALISWLALMVMALGDRAPEIEALREYATKLRGAFPK